MKKLFLILAFFLVGCASKDPIFIEVPEIHPQTPTGIQPVNVYLKVLKSEDKIYYGLDKENFILLNKFMIDLAEFLEKQQTLICFYQKDLCKKD